MEWKYDCGTPNDIKEVVTLGHMLMKIKENLTLTLMFKYSDYLISQL